MKNMLLLLLLVSNLIYSQSGLRIIKTLNVPKIGQEQKSWCMATSFQMILNSYRPTLSLNQKRVIWTHFYVDRGYKDAIKFDSTCLQYCNNVSLITANKSLDNCTRNIPHSGCNNYTIDNAKSVLLLKWFGLSSTLLKKKERSNFNWKLCQKQIDDGHPFILYNNGKNLYKKDTIPSHSVVVFGYVLVNDYKILLVNDPWRPCDGCQYGINFETLKNEFKGMIYDIKRDKKHTKNWKHFNERISEQSIICKDKLNKIIDTLTKYPSKELYKTLNSKKDYSTFDVQNYYNYINTKTLSEVYKMVIPQSNINTSFTFSEYPILPKIISPKTQEINKRISNKQNLTQSDTTKVVLGINPSSPFYLLKTLEYCTCSFLCCQESSDPCKIEKDITINDKTISIGPKDFTLLVDPINNVSFRKYKFENKEYVTPVQDTKFDKNLPFLKNKSYLIDPSNDKLRCPPICVRTEE
jgi:Peptidase_C39 like family